jgi:hypothetical protein
MVLNLKTAKAGGSAFGAVSGLLMGSYTFAQVGCKRVGLVEIGAQLAGVALLKLGFQLGDTIDATRATRSPGERGARA